MRYWLSRLSPTLIVAYSRRGNELYAGWVHRIPAVAKLGAAASPSRLSLRVPATPLDEARWSELIGESLRMQSVLVGAFDDDRLRQTFGLIHSELTSIADVLVEWVYALAYLADVAIPTAAGSTVPVPKLNTPHFLRDDGRPGHGGGKMFPMWLAGNAVALTESFRVWLQDHLDREHPLSKLVIGLADTLEQLNAAMYVDGTPRRARRWHRLGQGRHAAHRHEPGG